MRHDIWIHLSLCMNWWKILRHSLKTNIETDVSSLVVNSQMNVWPLPKKSLDCEGLIILFIMVCLFSYAWYILIKKTVHSIQTILIIFCVTAKKRVENSFRNNKGLFFKNNISLLLKTNIQCFSYWYILRSHERSV